MRNIIIFIVLPIILISFQNCGVDFKPESVPDVNNESIPSSDDQAAGDIDAAPRELEVISFKVVDSTSSSIEIEWTLSELAEGYLEYGENLSYGSTSLKGVLISGQKYSQQIEGLKPNTTYNFMIIATNTKNNIVESINFTGKTKALEVPVGLTSILAYETHLFDIVVKQCASCHGDSGNRAKFAVSNSTNSHNFLIKKGLVDLVKAENSKVYRRVNGGHAGKGKYAAEFLSKIKAWASSIAKP